jgi:16S rRNA (cytidine1402-2'-O)-methyltransferase
VEVLGAARPVVLAREVTKLHEEFLRGRAGELLGQLGGRELKGEITLLIGKAEAPAGPVAVPGDNLRARLDALMAAQQLDEKSALKLLAKELGVSKSEAYRRLQRSRK